MTDTERDGTHSLPSSWTWVSFEDCVEILDGQRVPVNSKAREERTAGKAAYEFTPYYGATGQIGWIDDCLFDEELVLLGEDAAPFPDPLEKRAYVVTGKS